MILTLEIGAQQCARQQQNTDKERMPDLWAMRDSVFYGSRLPAFYEMTMDKKNAHSRKSEVK